MNPKRLLWPLALFSSPSFGQFQLTKEYSGSSFFDASNWDFYNKYDNLTNGNVIYLDRDTALSSKLATVNDAQNAIIRVDNFTNVSYNNPRNSIRLDSTATYGLGSLWVIDVVHMPFGGPNWPYGGEIDIIEAVNKMSSNQFALHTIKGCTQVPGLNQIGKTGPTADCNQTSGCTVLDTTTPPTYGPNFNQAGGGVWATQFDVSGVFIWFWGRGSIPDSLQRSNTAQTLDVSSWGAPVASYPSVSCNMSEFFGEQNLVLDITLCGDWAGLGQVYDATCANQPPNTPNPVPPRPKESHCYPNNVVGPGSPLYDEAYFEISYIRAYTAAGVNPSSSSSSSGGSSISSPTSAAATTVTTTDPSSMDSGVPNASPPGSANVGSSLISQTHVLVTSMLVALAGSILGAWVLH